MALNHPQVTIQHHDLVAEVDEGIADLILACWQAHIWPWGSRQNINGFIWIGFPDASTAERFLSAAVGERSREIESPYRRLWLGDDEDDEDLPEDFDLDAWENRCWRLRATADEWITDPASALEVTIGINVDLPVTDYDAVLANVKRAAAIVNA